MIGGLKDVVGNAPQVLIKVNFIATRTYETGATTDPLVVEALIRKAKEFLDKIFVVESDATMTDADKACRATGMLQMCEDNTVKFINLRREKERVNLKIPNAEVLHRIRMPKIVADSAIINAAKLKTHRQTGVTLGMKNMFGLSPDKFKAKYHARNISKVVVDINSTLKPNLTVVDGFYGLEGPGPVSGHPVKMDLIIAGRDVVAVDATACRLMGIDPFDIYHIRRAHEKGLGEMTQDRIQLVGNSVEEVARKFKRS